MVDWCPIVRRLVLIVLSATGCIVQENPDWLGARESAGSTGTGESGGEASGEGSGTGSTGPDTAETDTSGTDTSGTDTTDTDTTSTDTTGTDTTGGEDTRLIFVTSTTQNGMLKGVGGADQLCAARAAAQALPGKFRAILGDGNTAANIRIVIDEPVINMQGQGVAATSVEFWGGQLSNAIAYDETGTPVTGHAWTGSDVNGFMVSAHCQSWSGQNGNGAAGDVTRTDFGWIHFGTDSCGVANALYCIEQP